MKSPEEFTAYFQSTMLPRLEVLEAERQRYLPRAWRYGRWLVLAWVLAMAAALAMGMSLWQVGRDLWPAHVVFVVAFLAVGTWRGAVFNTHTAALVPRCKDEVIVPMLRWLVPELTYDPQGSIAREVAEEGRLVGPRDSLAGEDHFRGRLGQTALEFCELRLHYVSTPGERSGTFRGAANSQRGLYFVASANKPFAGETRLYPDRLESRIGDAATRLLSIKRFPSRRAQGSEPADSAAADAAAQDGLHLIHMEDPAFEKLFKVYCTDDVEAHYILTPSLMERLTTYREKSERVVFINFRGARLYAWIPMPIFTLRPYDLFDVWAAEDLTAFKLYRYMYEDLAIAVSIVEELNLNTRIWGPPQPTQA